MIEAVDLVKSFGGLAAVDGVSFKVERGEVVGFLGPNGAGKSTTMRMLTGCLLPDRGTASIHGCDVRRNRRAAQALIGYLPEAAGLYPHLRVGEFLTYCGEARGLGGKALRRRIGELAERIELGPALSKQMSALSKGWRQRTWLAQALLHDPSVLVMDEPTDGLDPNQKDLVRRLIQEVSPSKAIILSTHQLEEAQEMCGRVIVIAAGKLVANEPIDGLTDDSGRLAPAFRRLTTTSQGSADDA